MGYCRFLENLFGDGRVALTEFAPLSEAELTDGDALIADYEQLSRLDMPGNAPQFDAAAGRWAAVKLFRACQFAVFRDIDAQTMSQELDEPWTAAKTPAVHYSVDLLFRFLPDLAKFATSAAEQDPLLETLNAWGRQWTLSSVGMPGIEPANIDGFRDDASLMQLYVDRIIAARDMSRLEIPAVRKQAASTLGLFPELAPRIAAALSSHDEPTETT